MSQHTQSIPPELRDPVARQLASAASLLWSDERLLGFGPMDATHEEFYRVAFGLMTCDSAGMQQALDAFDAHAREHFEQEEDWMRSTDFPPRDCHIEEHAAVLNSLRQVRKQIINGGAGLEPSGYTKVMRSPPGEPGS